MSSKKTFLNEMRQIENHTSTFGELSKSNRQLLGLTRAEFAKQLGCCPRSLKRYEEHKSIPWGVRQLDYYRAIAELFWTKIDSYGDAVSFYYRDKYRGIVDRLAKEVEEYKFLRKRRKIKLDKRVWFRIGHDLRIVRAFLVRLKKNAKEAQDNLSRGLRSKEDLSLAAKVR